MSLSQCERGDFRFMPPHIQNLFSHTSQEISLPESVFKRERADQTCKRLVATPSLRWLRGQCCPPSRDLFGRLSSRTAPRRQWASCSYGGVDKTTYGFPELTSRMNNTHSPSPCSTPNSRAKTAAPVDDLQAARSVVRTDAPIHSAAHSFSLHASKSPQ